MLKLSSREPGYFYLDEPVSNSRNLKYKILEFSKFWNFKTSVELVPNADLALQHHSHIISSDAIVLDSCLSYFNLSEDIIQRFIPDAFILTFSLINAVFLCESLNNIAKVC